MLLKCVFLLSKKWLIRMIKSDDGSQIKCSVERPGGSSYLFFQLFEMNVIGGLIKEAQVIVSTPFLS